MKPSLNQAILETAGEGIIGTNSVGIIIFANPSAEKLLKAKSGQLNGININKLIIFGAEENEWQKTPLVNAYLHGQSYREERRMCPPSLNARKHHPWIVKIGAISKEISAFCKFKSSFCSMRN